MGLDSPNTSYNTSSSPYQALIQNNVYQSVDMLLMAFVETIPTGPNTIPPGNGTSYTIVMQSISHPNGLTNQDYMNYVMYDARKNNPNIKFAVTLDYGGTGNQISSIFSIGTNSPQQNANNFAANLMAYLQYYNLDGFDVDWEGTNSGKITQSQFGLFFDAIRAQFKQQTNKYYYLTLSPDHLGNLNSTAVNNNIDFINFQFYGCGRQPDLVSAFTTAGVNTSLFAYGVGFTDNNCPTHTAVSAYNDNDANYHYNTFTTWALISTYWQYDQQQQQLLYQLCDTTGIYVIFLSLYLFSVFKNLIIVQFLSLIHSENTLYLFRSPCLIINFTFLYF